MSTSSADILVVDDQPENLRVLSEVLRQRGFQVRQATSGSIALKTVAFQPPDLILLDILMPKMDGYAVCAALKKQPQTREIPVIFLTALGEVTDKMKAFDLGGVDYITKPFQIGEVLVRINHQLQIRQQQQQWANLLQQFQQLNSGLEQQIQVQTLELQQALDYERTLKEISDRVRGSLDKTYILQATVEELTRVLQAQCYSIATNIICFHTDLGTSAEPYTVAEQLLVLPQVTEQLEQGITFAFCHFTGDITSQYAAVLGCPIRDDRTWLGTVWLLKPLLSSFSQSEIRMVQQITDQCAIALHQAELYEKAQAQIVELHRLNQLKDDFLNTVSHEFRAPATNMKMVLQLLLAATEQGQTFLTQMAENGTEDNRIVQYFKILQAECDREITLIHNLLNLQYLEAETRPLDLITLDLNEWLLHILEPYKLRTQNQQQQLIVQLASNLPPLTTDAACLSRIIVELLENACKYTPPHETITVSTEALPAQVLIHIHNSGIEIPPAEQLRIFDKFYRIPNNDPWKHGSTGLGLALASQLANHLHGSIEVNSGDDLWTCFTLKLPNTPLQP